MNIRKAVDYSTMFVALKAVMKAVLPQMELYCKVGQIVCARLEKGAAVAAAEFLKEQYPDMTGFSPRNVRRMRDFWQMYSDIQGGEFPLTIHQGRQNNHVPGTREYKQYVEHLQREGRHGPSKISISGPEIEHLIETYKGTGNLARDKRGRWRNEELITVHPGKIGIAVNDRTGKEADTTVFRIHYSKDGVHISPDYPSKKGAKCRK